MLFGAAALTLINVHAPFDRAFIGAAADEPALPGLLGRVTNLRLFAGTMVPGSALTVFTELRYADAGALAAGRVAGRTCYARRDDATGPVSHAIDLGHQDRDEGPVFVDAAVITPDEAATVNSTPEALADLARRFCRFRG